MGANNHPHCSLQHLMKEEAYVLLRKLRRSALSCAGLGAPLLQMRIINSADMMGRLADASWTPEHVNLDAMFGEKDQALNSVAFDCDTEQVQLVVCTSCYAAPAVLLLPGQCPTAYPFARSIPFAVPHMHACACAGISAACMTSHVQGQPL